MPHRLLDLPPFVLHLVEGSILSMALAYNAFSFKLAFISESDWNRLTGPHGVAFIAVVACVVLWFNKISSDKARAKELAAQDAKEDKRRDDEEKMKETRHQESLKASNAYAESVLQLAIKQVEISTKVDATLNKIGAQNKAIISHLTNGRGFKEFSQKEEKKNELPGPQG